MASSASGIIQYTEASGVWNTTGVVARVIKDIKKILMDKIGKFQKDNTGIAEAFTKNVETVETMLAA